MLDAVFGQTNYVAAKQMLDATALRHEAIASNLANLETPNYKRVDLAPSFSTELDRAVASKDNAAILKVKPRIAVDTQAVSRRQDGNTVQLEDEMMRLSQNTLEHTLDSQLISGTLVRLRAAITGRSA
jgi:flagellar basal-body rod protein FlgB